MIYTSYGKHNYRTAIILILMFVNVSYFQSVYAQFSPGELSRFHQQLEGSQNCTQCHELGKEISGKKCMQCHTEIQKSIEQKHGFHFNNASLTCVTCHKEHLGREAKTVQFDEKTFDHGKTGFFLTGKHISTACKDCHSTKNMKDTEFQKKITDASRFSYMGLLASCQACHKDVHEGTFKQDCNSCHSTIAWNKNLKFDHGTTQFALTGSHNTVSCNKCHKELGNTSITGKVDFATERFTDCAPCHTSPHRTKFEKQSCSSCHRTDDWKKITQGAFDHNQTSFILKGRHIQLRCEQCHAQNKQQSLSSGRLKSRQQCTDCHTDKHNGEFQKQYSNNCAECHTESGYKPSTYTIARHEKSRFPLTGSHIAIVCSECHYRADTRSNIFQFSSLTCETCHQDIHRKQFNGIAGSSECSNCHTTRQWNNPTFDHSKTNFRLIGKHATTTCSQCHQQKNGKGISTLIYKGLSQNCESCHNDKHQGQFAVSGRTNCNSCHSPEGWRQLVFQHETQSTFSLQGAHLNVACQLCHKPETAGNVTFIRYKPLSKTCESCHGERKFDQ